MATNKKVDGISKKLISNEQFFNRLKAEVEARAAVGNEDVKDGKETQIFVAAFHHDPKKPNQIQGVIMSKVQVGVLCQILEQIVSQLLPQTIPPEARSMLGEILKHNH